MALFTGYIFVSGELPANVVIGGWQPPFGINFVLTTMSVGFVFLSTWPAYWLFS
jgi:multicomponent Na+:H+ antiporter subunit D